MALRVPLGGYAPEEKGAEAWLSSDPSAEELDLGDPWGNLDGSDKKEGKETQRL